MIYIRYLQIFRRLETAYDQIAHPQKRQDVRRALEACMGRMLEVRARMRMRSAWGRAIASRGACSCPRMPHAPAQQRRRARARAAMGWKAARFVHPHVPPAPDAPRCANGWSNSIAAWMRWPWTTCCSTSSSRPRCWRCRCRGTL